MFFVKEIRIHFLLALEKELSMELFAASSKKYSNSININHNKR